MLHRRPNPFLVDAALPDPMETLEKHAKPSHRRRNAGTQSFRDERGKHGIAPLEATREDDAYPAHAERDQTNNPLTNPRCNTMARNSVLSTGDKAPDFTLDSDTGEDPTTLSELRGSPVVVYFYPKDNTPGCTTEACDFRDNLNRIKAAGATVLGISPDGLKSHAKFRGKHELNFPLLADEDHKVAEAWGVWREKKNFGKTYDGIVRSTFLIDANGKIAEFWDNVRVKGHVDKVIAAIEELD